MTHGRGWREACDSRTRDSHGRWVWRLYQTTSEVQSGFAEAQSWSEPGLNLTASALETHTGLKER
jgi:hypothetical protein